MLTFVANYKKMAKSETNRGIYWIYALVSFVITVLLLIFANAWFWVGLPFLLTSLVLAFDKM